MVAVLDQYEVEYKETYTSGTYDQVVMGKMFSVETYRGIKRYVPSLRGVVFGSINAEHYRTPGSGSIDFTNSVSYRLQPYREKAGNCRAAKLMCYQERIYDTLLPDPLSCFKLDGANPFAIVPSQNETPGVGPSWGIDAWSNAFIIFDNYIPEGNSSDLRNLNPGVDRHWTKAFPYEPKYAGVRRQKSLSLKDVEVSYDAKFKTSTMTLLATKKIMKRLIFGTVGRIGSLKPDKISSSYQYSSSETATGRPPAENWFHYWAADSNISPEPYVGGRFIPVNTGSLTPEDSIKVLFGYGDSSTTFFSEHVDSNNPIGYALRGTTNWPTFRSKKRTDTSYSGYPGGSYETITGSFWNVSPVIRGWKYGIYNGLADYTSAYFRQGKYGQFRDMLEQRIFVSSINEDVAASTVINGPVSIKFLDSDQNLTEPANTQSQNLSQYATSSLPYFDLQARNRPTLKPLTNLSLVNFNVDRFNNITI